MRWTWDVAEALALLTRLPAPRIEAPRGAVAAWAWPTSGLAVALVAGLVASVAWWAGLPPAVIAGLALTAQVMATGAMHEDGLSDVADGFWGGWTAERRLEIMRDSTLGTYGVAALVLSLLLRWACLAQLAAAEALIGGLIVAATASRACMAPVMAWLANARDDGLSRGTGRPSWTAAGIGGALALAGALLLAHEAVPGILVACGLSVALVGWLAREKIGGQTGDVAGATQQVAEIGVLMALVA
ncbi:MAG: adenosylcobinamide-GDP ribazoletransferase [Paracoccaceae bacterium]